MKDLNKIEEAEKPIEEQNDSIKEASGSTVDTPKVVTKKIRARDKAKPVPANLSEIDLTIVAEEDAPVIESKPDSKKGGKTKEKIVLKKPQKKEKPESEPMIQNVVLIDAKEEHEKPASDKKKIVVIKKKAKKAEEKVDKLKKKVKKAKKNDIKKSKLKNLKDKLVKALDKLKIRLKKLKKAKK